MLSSLRTEASVPSAGLAEQGSGRRPSEQATAKGVLRAQPLSPPLPNSAPDPGELEITGPTFRKREVSSGGQSGTATTMWSGPKSRSSAHPSCDAPSQGSVPVLSSLAGPLNRSRPSSDQWVSTGSVQDHSEQMTSRMHLDHYHWGKSTTLLEVRRGKPGITLQRTARSGALRLCPPLRAAGVAPDDL